MKKHVENIRRWLGGAADEHVVRRVAFWWLVYYQGAKGAKDVSWMLPVDIDTIRIVK